MNINNLLDGVFDIPKELNSEFGNIKSICLKDIRCEMTDIGKAKLAICLSTKFDDWRIPTIAEMQCIFHFRNELLSAIPDVYDENNIDRKTSRIYWYNELQPNGTYRQRLCGFWGVFATYANESERLFQKNTLLLVR